MDEKKNGPVFLKKGNLGFLEKCPEEDAGVIEVRMTFEEFAKKRQDLYCAEYDLAREREKNGRLLSENDRLKSSVADLEEEVYKQTELINDLYAEKYAQETVIRLLQDDVDNEKDLNKNLLRISKERANADRSLSDKKNHDGYVVLSIRQTDDGYVHYYTDDDYKADPGLYNMDRTFERRTAVVWKTTIQTPFPAHLPFNNIEARVLEDLDKKVLPEMGCPFDGDQPYSGQFSEEVCGTYKLRFCAQFNRGYWEVEIFSVAAPRVTEKRINV